MPWTFDITMPFGLKQLKSLIFRFAKIYYQKRFNDRSNGFPFGQQPVNRLLPKKAILDQPVDVEHFMQG